MHELTSDESAFVEVVRRPEAELSFDTVTKPVMVGTGSASAPRFQRSVTTLRDRLPNAMMVEVADSEHGVHLSHPAEFAAFVRASVARWKSSTLRA